ncbi:hypothetical protein [Isoptericola sediminis]|uniref:Uncharacterized protein n=1 Tax=Isoptericola sediminis TaxID=2733572 RepID=A0A849K718_9MICO|nr:hypothetical protein [Isoptericola sediminis]NNU27819.1 hypothetical protein [Isoptericola sediminis]
MVAAVGLVAVLALLGVLQVLVACGAPLGAYVWGGRYRVLPARLRVGSLLAVAVYAAIAVVALDRAGVVDVLPDGAARVTMWVVVVWFAVSIVPNAISRSRPERLVMTPVTVLLTVLAILVALG